MLSSSVEEERCQESFCRHATNNLAEQAVRFLVIDRQITQGPRGEKGRQWCERIRTTVATCAT